MSGDSGDSHSAKKRRADVARALFFGAIAVGLLLWVALYNGYPTVFPDTGAYLYTGAFFVALAPFRAPGYSMFAHWTSLGTSAWFTAIAQAILMVIVLFETCEHMIGGDARFRANSMLAIALALAGLTSLPWEVSLLMPDFFAGIVFLCVFLLTFHRALRLGERILLAVILAISVSAHASLLPIAAVFVAALGIARLAARRAQWAPPARTAFAWVLVPIVAAGLWTATLNRRMGLGFHLSVSGNEFLLGRLFGDGLAADYLRENCPSKPYAACKYLGNLPRTSEQFLFWHPLLHELDGHREEITELVHGTLAAYPLKFIQRSFVDTLRQFVRFRSGDEMRDFALNAPNWNPYIIQTIYPRDYRAFMNSRMIRGRLLATANAAAALHTAVFWLSAAACLGFAWARRAPQLNRFLYAAIAFLAINAAISATLAGVYDRYQSRVAWMVPLCLALYFADWFLRRNARISQNPS
jgi:hypothetical protein